MDIYVQVGISIFKVLLQITRPKTMMLGNIPGTGIYRDLDHYKEAIKTPGFLILSIEAPVNFVNTTYLKERLVHCPSLNYVKLVIFIMKHVKIYFHFFCFSISLPFFYFLSLQKGFQDG